MKTIDLSNKSVTIAQNAVTAKLVDASRELKLLVQSILSYKVEGAEHTLKFKTSSWNGRSSFLDFASGTFPSGFSYLVQSHLSRRGYTVRHLKQRLPEPNGPEEFWKFSKFGRDPRYDYQVDVVDQLIKYGQIIAMIATGGGKSLVTTYAFARIQRPTLFLTTRAVLMYQMKDSIEEALKIKVSVLGDGHWGHINSSGTSCIKQFSVGMVQTLASRLKDEATRDQTISLLEKFELVIGEEAHEVSGSSYTDIMKHCKNANYRLALTATPFMKDDEEANMRLMASFGPVAVKVSEKELIEKGILAKPYFKYVDLHKKPEKMSRNTPWQPAYRIGIVDNDERNALIVEEVVRAARHSLTALVLVQQVKHGDKLEEMLSEKGLKISFIRGENDQIERKKALTDLSSGILNVVIGTSILEVGVDVPSIGLIVLAGGGKAQVALRQRIGRGLRAKKKGGNVAFIVDFNDPHNCYLTAHYKTRRYIVEKTEGFVDGILEPGKDFDYNLLKGKTA